MTNGLFMGLQNSAYTPTIFFRMVRKCDIDNWIRRIRIAVQRNDMKDLPWLRPFVYLYRLINLISKYFIERRIHVRAGALTYYTAFALVPLFAFIMALARGFGFDSYLENLLIERFANHGEMVSLFLDLVDNYLEHAQGGIFVGVGIIVLLWSIYRMFNQIERAFNDIWGIEAKRPLKFRIPNYIAIMFFVPILILLTSGVSFYFRHAIQYFNGTFLITPSLQFLLNVLPYIVTWLTFTLLYWFVPNTQVKFKYAAVSGFIFGIAFVIFKWGYVYIQTWMTSYNAVYGALAAIPFLLMFLQFTWILVLLGCSFTFATQCLTRFDHAEDVRFMSHRYFEFAMLVVTKKCIDRHITNSQYVTMHELTEEMPYRMAKACLDKLCRARVLDKVEIAYGVYGYRPRLELSDLSIGRFYDAVDGEGTPAEKFKLHQDSRYAYLWNMVKEFRKKMIANDDQLIKDIRREV